MWGTCIFYYVTRMAIYYNDLGRTANYFIVGFQEATAWKNYEDRFARLMEITKYGHACLV